tara:strand:- start:133 stop:513 length:381 start_codon:yes stop_codon:yes gene_type:complete
VDDMAAVLIRGDFGFEAIVFSISKNLCLAYLLPDKMAINITELIVIKKPTLNRTFLSLNKTKTLVTTTISKREKIPDLEESNRINGTNNTTKMIFLTKKAFFKVLISLNKISTITKIKAILINKAE